ncbi:LysR substrate-binding domain-containing protein [Nocardia yamanashiensis]|uniref:LysR family transcriptional regulator n=1 Tax=Nocardia yamanashiensis TaxID=209247 RepID=UPI001E5DAB9F|nr:LysR substrate-binding domain-containing protein [Nocardia yamanashiensis]UGT46020.1 LysR substrate-binding domain-containing protein [Nocardia yamanashiensis]
MRDIEIFLTLAQELHFGRTAQRLHISQSRVSHAIRTQERRIGAPLFLRSSRTVRLTPLGEQLATELRAGSRLIESALTRAQSAAQGLDHTLTLGIMGALGHVVEPILTAFTDAFPRVNLVLREAHFSDPFALLRTGDADLQLLWLPIREPEFTIGSTLLVEPMRLAVSTASTLSTRDTVTLEDLADQTLCDIGTVAPRYWSNELIPPLTPSGRPIPRGPRVHTFQEMLAAIAADRAVALVQEHCVHYYARPGITYIPMPDGPHCAWTLIWRTHTETALIRTFDAFAARRS